MKVYKTKISIAGSEAKNKLIGKKGSVVGGVLTVVIGIILIVGVAIPITQQVIDDQNLTGLSGTVVGFIPVFLAIGALVLGAYMVMGKGK